jgi:tungstate transport system ATP-binding protein
MATALLALRDISVLQGGTATLQIAALDVYPGEVVAVIGPNGAGKSTLLRVMGQLQNPNSGKVVFRGKEATAKNSLAMRRSIASVFQEPLLLNASVYDNAALGLKLRGLEPVQIEKQLRPWLERFDIAHLISRPARTLSGGEAQRINLARAFAVNPELLLLDEPFSALDALTREGLLLDLQEILTRTSITTVVVTHDLREAAVLGKRIGVLNRGKLLQLAAQQEVLAHPASAEVAALVGVENRIPGVVEGVADGMSVVCFSGGSVKVTTRFNPGTRVILCIRPEEINLTRVSEEESGANETNRIKAQVARFIPCLAQYRISLRCSATSVVALLAKDRFAELGLREGDEVVASFDAKGVHVIGPGAE